MTSSFLDELRNHFFKLGVRTSLGTTELSLVVACSLPLLILPPFSLARPVSVVTVVVPACHAISDLFGNGGYPKKQRRLLREGRKKVSRRDRRRHTQKNLSL